MRIFAIYFADSNLIIMTRIWQEAASIRALRFFDCIMRMHVKGEIEH